MQRTGWLRLGAGLLTLGILGSTATAYEPDPAAAFEVLSAETVRLENLPATPDQPFEVNVVIEGEQHTLLLGAWSLRSDHFQVLTIGDDGVPTPFEASEPLTVRGGSLQDPSIVVAGSLLPDGLKVVVTRVGAQQISWGIEPMKKIDPNADRAEHVIYRVDESLSEGLCGNDNHVLEDLHQGDQGELNGRVLKLTEIAHDADFPFYQLNGSNETNVINDIENVMASVTVVYERDTEITWENTTMIIRTSSGADPYSSTDPQGLLNQFRAEWLSNFPVASFPRDLGHLWTGRNINGSVIGIAASIGGVCTSNSYCLSQSRFTGNFASRVALTAHEIGHVYGAFHCNQSPFVASPCNIMCSGLGGCNGVGLPNFGPQSIQFIIDHAATRTCLEDVPENLVPPVVDDFDGAGGLPDPAIWETTSAAVTSNFAQFEPSGSRALNIFGTGSVSSVSATFAGPDPLYVGLWAAANGVDPGQALLFEYFDTNSAQFEELIRFEPTEAGAVDTLFEYKVAELPASANSTDARFRIRSTGGTQWYVDSMRIDTAMVLHGLPFVDHVDGTDISSAHWFKPTLAEFDAGSIALTIFDTLTSVPIQGDYWLNDSRPMFMSFTVDQNDVPAGMSLIAEVSDGIGGWVELINVPSGGPGSSGPETVQAPIPVSSQTNPMQVRIRTEGTVVFQTSYLVDDIVVGDAVDVTPPTCVGDIADDFGTAGSDGMVSFGDFLAMLGLVGPCPGGTPGCDGDIADAFGTINGGDGMVDFGDFLALLGLVGPCP